MASVTLGIIIGYALGFNQGDAITIGLLVAFIDYIQKFFQPLKELSNKFAILQHALASLEKIFGLFNITETMPKLESKLSSFNGFIEFKNISGLKEEINIYVDKYNNKRFNSSIGYKKKYDLKLEIVLRKTDTDNQYRKRLKINVNIVPITIAKTILIYIVVTQVIIQIKKFIFELDKMSFISFNGNMSKDTEIVIAVRVASGISVT